MADLNRPSGQESFLEEPGKMPGMINVVTILTFIGCAIALYFQYYGFAHAQETYDTVVASQDKLDQVPAMFKKMMGPDPIGVARRSLDNRTPILLLGLVATGLCIYGAIEMRKLKKIGFWIYSIGEILPILTTCIFVGTAAFTPLILGFTLFFTALFIILYATQLKYLK